MIFTCILYLVPIKYFITWIVISSHYIIKARESILGHEMSVNAGIGAQSQTTPDNGLLFSPLSTWEQNIFIHSLISRSFACLRQLLGELRNNLEKITFQTVVGHFQDWRVGIAVDCDDLLGVLHTSQMLNST